MWALPLLLGPQLVQREINRRRQFSVYTLTGTVKTGTKHLLLVGSR